MVGSEGRKKNERSNSSKEIIVSWNLLIKDSIILSNVIILILIVIEDYDLNYHER
jgi:hypothetical protein